MRMTARSCYSVLAAAALAEARAEGKAVPVSRLAVRTGAPEDFLVQVLQGLRRAGVVESVRGVSGGFRLAAPPGQVTVGQVLRAAEGHSGFLEASDSCARAVEGAADRGPEGELGFVLSEVERALAQVLDGLTLAAVVERGAGRRAGGAPEYQI